MEYQTECGCIVVSSPPNFKIKYCPKHKAAPKLYEALLAVYQDIELQNVAGGSAELNLLVDQALASVEEK